MKDTGCQCGISFSIFKHFHKVFHCTASATCNNRYRKIFGQLPCQFNSKPLFCSIVIHGGKQNFTGTQHHSVLCPIKTKFICLCSSAIQIHIPFSILLLFCINCQHYTLTSEFTVQVIYQL